ncbi:MAG TPA: hypothetical protein VFS92_00890 [Planctomycetota bacterium]|nr:hypothetical protein [Planctomycetota bacterium]
MTVRLQEGLVFVDTDPARSVRPSDFFNEISRVALVPVEMEVVARGAFENGAFVVDGGRWPLVDPAAKSLGPGPARLKVAVGAEDPPRVTPLPPGGGPQRIDLVE